MGMDLIIKNAKIIGGRSSNPSPRLTEAGVCQVQLPWGLAAG